jgi:acetylornithine deacetylase/succinyl-diaminopimelate desuccinylase-like protein
MEQPPPRSLMPWRASREPGARHPIPTVLFGYGILNLHHAIDEQIEVSALVRTAQVYAVALLEWLGVAAP